MIAPRASRFRVLRPLGPASDALTTGELVENQSCRGRRLVFAYVMAYIRPRRSLTPPMLKWRRPVRCG